MVNVRHILIQPEDAEDETTWMAAEELAQSIYERWQREGATEERFAELADMETEDPGSQACEDENGGGRSRGRRCLVEALVPLLLDFVTTCASYPPPRQKKRGHQKQPVCPQTAPGLISAFLFIFSCCHLEGP